MGNPKQPSLCQAKKHMLCGPEKAPKSEDFQLQGQ